MTGDIRATLLKGDAGQSLLMEAMVASHFREQGWPSNQGMYYTDLTSGKIREVDVHAYKTHSQKKGRIGEPVANVHIFAECKNLSGQHIIFSPGVAPDYLPVEYFWLGHSEPDEPLLKILMQRLQIESPELEVKLYAYLKDRTHPDGRELLGGFRLPPPKVEIVARGFRETNTKAVKEEDASAIWRTCQSLLSATRSARERSYNFSTEALRETTITGELPGTSEWFSDIAVFLDFELARSVFFHSAIFTNARLWQIRSNEITEISSARLIISNIDHEDAYVDVVSAHSAEEYIASTTSQFDKELSAWVKKAKQRFQKLHWSPGENASILMNLSYCASPRKRKIRRRKS